MVDTTFRWNHRFRCVCERSGTCVINQSKSMDGTIDLDVCVSEAASTATCVINQSKSMTVTQAYQIFPS